VLPELGLGENLIYVNELPQTPPPPPTNPSLTVRVLLVKFKDGKDSSVGHWQV
jgi:hypothetical protein